MVFTAVAALVAGVGCAVISVSFMRVLLGLFYGHQTI